MQFCSLRDLFLNFREPVGQELNDDGVTVFSQKKLANCRLIILTAALIDQFRKCRQVEFRIRMNVVAVSGITKHNVVVIS